MIIYRGKPERVGSGGFFVEREYVDKEGFPHNSMLDPGPSQKLFNHSPDGFSWGYSGSGCAQLALAILLDVTGNKEVSVKYHQSFKTDFVAGWEQNSPWTFTDKQVWDWLKLRDQGIRV